MTIIGIITGWLILIIAITIHEAAHAWMADRLGDPTARIAGRLTINPLAHIDPIGTVVLPLLLALSGSGFLIGWAKPTPFDIFNLRNPKRDAALIALAGPVSNLLLAVMCAVFVRFLTPGLLDHLLISLLRINVFLAIFNLLPIHPLDGFKVVAGILPKQYYASWMSLQRYGLLFLIILLFPLFGSSPIGAILGPIVRLIISILIPGGVGGTI